MNNTLCLSVRFIQPVPLFHGSRDAGEPEWPPSPMRVFQALLNAACLRTRGKTLPTEVRSALKVLEVLRPHVIAPAATQSTVGHRAYVPHNHADLVTAAWHRGNTSASIAEHRIEKDHRPMRITTLDDDMPTVHYLYPLADINTEPQSLLESLRPSVRSIYSLGWGIDQVIADASLIDDTIANKLTGERYAPTTVGGTPLRTPRNGSLDALHARHDRFLARLRNGEWTPVPPLTSFDTVRYRRACDPVPRPYAIFRLLDSDDHPARYPHAQLVHVAGMVRHLAIQRMLPNPPPWHRSDAEAWVNAFVRGKADDNAEPLARLSYVPLPSIGHAHSDAMVRNVMLVAPLGAERDLEYVASRLDGQMLQPEPDSRCAWEHQCNAPHPAEIRLERFTPPRGRFIDTCYLCPDGSSVWQSVTPVILDGHNDKKDAKTIRLIQLALQRAGIETPCDFTWQAIPFFQNCLSAHKYDRDRRFIGYHRPQHLKDRTAVHVKLWFHDGSEQKRPIAVPGPITLGAGRHCGFGLLARTT